MTQTMGQWDIDFDSRLGKGGYASVYLCRKSGDEDYNSAIKIYEKSHYVNIHDKEVRVLNAIAELPLTPRILDQGRDEQGRLCIVTERIPGESLKSYVGRNGPLSLGQTLSFLQTILAVLEVSHGMGWVHLDLKPSNFMVGEEGYFLLDWGGAKNLNVTKISTVHSMEDYVAPESYSGSFCAATDFYALGLLAVFALTGQRPYHFDSIKDVGYRALAHCIERPNIPETVPESIRPLILSWLNKDPSARLCCYDLNRALAQAKGAEQDFSTYKLLTELNELAVACSYRECGARFGIPYAQHHYWKQLLTENKKQDGLYWLEQAAEQGYAKAAYRLAMVLSRMKGKAGKKHAKRIDPLLRQSVAKGNRSAKVALAKRMLRGNSAGGDVAAEALLREAADEGYGRAQYVLAKWLLTTSDAEAEVAKYMRLSADRGYESAIKYLGQVNATT